MLKRRVSAGGLPPLPIQLCLHLSRREWKLQGPLIDSIPGDKAELKHIRVAGLLNTDEQGVRSMPEGPGGDTRSRDVRAQWV